MYSVGFLVFPDRSQGLGAGLASVCYGGGEADQRPAGEGGGGGAAGQDQHYLCCMDPLCGHNETQGPPAASNGMVAARRGPAKDSGQGKTWL